MDKARHNWAKRVRLGEGLCALIENADRDEVLATLIKDRPVYTLDFAQMVPKSCPDVKSLIAQAHAKGHIVVVNNTYPTSALCAPGLWGADIIWEEVAVYTKQADPGSVESCGDKKQANAETIEFCGDKKQESPRQPACPQNGHNTQSPQLATLGSYIKKVTSYSFVGIGKNTILTRSEIQDIRALFAQVHICDSDLAESLYLGQDAMQDYERAASDCASVVATYLRCHPKVSSVRYMGLKQDPSKANAACVFRAGFGSSIDFQIGTMSCEEILAFTQNLKATGGCRLEVCEGSLNKEELWFRLQVSPCQEKEIIVALETALKHV